MSSLTFDQLRKVNVERCEHPTKGFCHKIQDWTEDQWTNALCGESGEAANFSKKLSRLRMGFRNFDEIPEPYKNIPGGQAEYYKQCLARELADIVCYADLTAAKLGVDLGQVVIDKFNEVSDKLQSPIKL